MQLHDARFPMLFALHSFSSSSVAGSGVVIVEAPHDRLITAAPYWSAAVDRRDSTSSSHTSQVYEGRAARRAELAQIAAEAVGDIARSLGGGGDDDAVAVQRSAVRLIWRQLASFDGVLHAVPVHQEGDALVRGADDRREEAYESRSERARLEHSAEVDSALRELSSNTQHSAMNELIVCILLTSPHPSLPLSQWSPLLQ